MLSLVTCNCENNSKLINIVKDISNKDNINQVNIEVMRDFYKVKFFEVIVGKNVLKYWGINLGYI